jgi:molecular chaperone HtpG
MPDSYNLIVNTNHPVIGSILKEKDEKRQDELTNQLTDLAKLSQNLLKGKEMTDFIKRSIDLIGK